MSAQIVPMDINTPEPGSLMEAALKYAALNWKIVPCWWIEQGACACGKEDCKSPGKHPIGAIAPFGQNSATTDASTIRKWWLRYPKASVATYLAPSGLCAIDIDPRNGGYDTIDALEAKHGRLESDLLQFTGGGGEHRVFQAPAAGNLPGKLGPGVDVKQNGYIMLEPSGHLSGKRYEWEASSSPLDGCTASPLPDWVRDLAAPVMVGAGADMVEQTRYPLSDDEIAQIGEAVAYIPSDDRETWLTIGMAIHAAIGGQRGFSMWDGWSQSSAKYNPVDLTRVWRSFRLKGFSGVNKGTLFDLAMKHGWVNTGPVVELPFISVTVPEDEIIDAAPVELEKITPANLLTIPVEPLQKAVEWMEGFSEEPNRQISVHGALALGSVLAGRIYQSVNGNVSSMYLLTLAGTGLGKGYPKHAIRKLMSESRLGNLLSGSGNTSAGAVFSALFKAPTHIQISDEFGKHLQTARRQINGAMSDAFAVMTEAYSDATGVLVPRNYSNFHLSKKEITQLDSKIVQHPAVTLYAFATPEQVLDNMSTSEIDDGFLNRFVVVDVTESCMPERRIKSAATPEALINWARSMRRADGMNGTDMNGVDTDYDMMPSPVTVNFSKEAWAAFDAFKAEIKSGEFVERRLTMRWRENAMRLATTLAACENQEIPVVSGQLANWSIAYVRHYGMTFMQKAVMHIADNDFHRLYLAVREKIESSGARGITEKYLSEGIRLFKRSAPMLRKQVFEALMREEAAKLVAFNSASGRGKKRSAWVAAAHVPKDCNDD